MTYTGLLSSAFVVAASVSYFGDFVPTTDPLVDLGASAAIAAVSTLTTYAGAKFFNNLVIMGILGGVLGFWGADKISDDIFEHQQAAPATITQPQNTLENS